MAIDGTLARVAEDLACGNVASARQRLKGLCGSFPQRLDLRERLAAVYRLEGDLDQAGRWSYLSENADPGEVLAFEQTYREPVRLMAAIGWRGEESDAETAFARERLLAIRSRAEKSVGCPLAWEKPQWTARPTTWGDRLAGVVGCLLTLAVVAVFCVGLATLAVWAWYAVTG
ncbi:MAG: DUF6584 family protein [Sporichthyaceae bacterium]